MLGPCVCLHELLQCLCHWLKIFRDHIQHCLHCKVHAISQDFRHDDIIRLRVTPLPPCSPMNNRNCVIFFHDMHWKCGSGFVDFQGQCCAPHQDLKRIDELLYNPFSARIASIFSEDGSGRLSFKNFLELFSVFSPRASFDVKVIFLFAIWDFDGAHLRAPRELF